MNRAEYNRASVSSIQVLNNAKLPEPARLREIVDYILEHGELPDTEDLVPMIEVGSRFTYPSGKYQDGVSKLADLRGIDLSGISLPEKLDLSYCIFDGAKFVDTQLNYTGIQSSFLQRVDFSRAQMTGIQADSAVLLENTVDGLVIQESFFVRTFMDQHMASVPGMSESR